MITHIGIDPGTTESAYAAMSNRTLVKFNKVPNAQLLELLDFFRLTSDAQTVLVVEMVESYGMPVGHEVFMTCVWLGRFIERWRGKHELISRSAVRWQLCRDRRAKDPNVRAALIELYGGKATAIGKKGSIGPLHGVTEDVWSALAVVRTYQDKADVGSGIGGSLLR